MGSLQEVERERMGTAISQSKRNWPWIKRKKFFPGLQSDGRKVKKGQQLGTYGTESRKGFGSL